jgi:hypothetical protein
MDRGGIKVVNPMDGTYRVTIFGASDRNFQIEVSYGGSDFAEEHELWGYYGSNLVTFDVIVNTSAAPRLSVVPVAISPEVVQANPDATGALTVISWQPGTEQGVIGYRIYSAAETAPYFNRLGTVDATVSSFLTSDSWSGSSAVPAKTYAVTAVKSDGTESFFSSRVQNDDRDHDLLTDANETTLGTDPTRPDTDGDSYSDYVEVNAGSNPLLPSSIPAGEVRTLADVLRYLQVLSGMTPSSELPVEVDDINQNGRIGMEEVLNVLKQYAK